MDEEQVAEQERVAGEASLCGIRRPTFGMAISPQGNIVIAANSTRGFGIIRTVTDIGYSLRREANDGTMTHGQ